eukprot:CAMPEP_0198439294 /NCGR_PEP_ID=MMETSP1452-20131203/54435_1 /TAXON_ID=1181717 /ORGANISM="Synchroma pusillum, Strain CCMP3072" /LENGTH=61 /DNA_ID=CAMNT_0044159897 /DNA_START=69 /DNA_END=250 /DNA_ORIENTATION=-
MERPRGGRYVRADGTVGKPTLLSTLWKALNEVVAIMSLFFMSLVAPFQGAGPQASNTPFRR